MSLVSEILSLRHDRFSSVARLMAAINRQGCPNEQCRHFVARDYAVKEAADTVLLNVAAHAADHLGESPGTRKNRRAVVAFRRKPRRVDPDQLHQRRLFA
jgi:hypothetical protein